jgi:glycosyltransferase involved in cell wall biosynthesis
MREAFAARGACVGRIDVVLNSADETVFDRDATGPVATDGDRFTLICHGALEERYGLDTILRAAALLRPEIPGLRIELFGDGSYRSQLERLARELGLDGSVRFSDGWAPLEELRQAIATADAGVVAIRRDAFRDLMHCNKMFDFITMRRPAIVSRTRSVEAYFDEDCFLMFESGNPHDLARAVRQLHGDPALGRRLVTRAAAVNEPYRWPRQRELYLRIVQRLVAEGRAAAPARRRLARWAKRPELDSNQRPTP